MAIPVTNIPVLTGEVAERFIEQCEYNFSQVPTYNNTSFKFKANGTWKKVQ